MTGKFYLHCGPDRLILAARAANWGSTEMPGKSGLLVFGEEGDEVMLYVSRTKAGGITVRDVTPEPIDG